MISMSRSVVALVIAAALVTALSGSGGSDARASVQPEATPVPTSGSLFYVSGSDRAILRYSFSSHRTRSVVTVSESSGIAKVGRTLFWQQYTTRTCGGSPVTEIMSVSLTSANPKPRRFLNCVYLNAGLVAVHGYLYFGAIDGIGRISTTGKNLNRHFIPMMKQAEGDSINGLATDGRHLYFTRCDNSSIGRVAINGSGLNYQFAAAARGTCPQPIAVGGKYVYWGSDGFGKDKDIDGVGRVRLDGTQPQPRWQSVHTGQVAVSLAADARHVYWDWGGAGNSPTYVGRVGTDRRGFTKRWAHGHGAFLLTTPGANA
jgi:hypothetical protein